MCILDEEPVGDLGLRFRCCDRLSCYIAFLHATCWTAEKVCIVPLFDDVVNITQTRIVETELFGKQVSRRSLGFAIAEILNSLSAHHIAHLGYSRTNRRVAFFPPRNLARIPALLPVDPVICF